MPTSYSYTMDGGGVGGGGFIRGFPSVVPSYSLYKIPTFRTHVIEYGNRNEQRIALNTSARHTFKLQWEVLRPQRADLIYNFFLAMKGNWEAFYWTNPVDTRTYLVRFVNNTVEEENFRFHLYRYQSVEFIEVAA